MGRKNEEGEVKEKKKGKEGNSKFALFSSKASLSDCKGKYSTYPLTKENKHFLQTLRTIDPNYHCLSFQNTAFNKSVSYSETTNGILCPTISSQIFISTLPASVWH